MQYMPATKQKIDYCKPSLIHLFSQTKLVSYVPVKFPNSSGDRLRNYRVGV